ncbi:MAG TPA: GNAT family N-acetyltransferase [Anaerolineae bacterium]
MNSLTTALRPAGPDDEEFLYQVYACTREDEMALARAQLGWDAGQVAAFLRMQSDAQKLHYRGQYPRASWQVIEVAGRPAGRLIVDRPPDELHLMDIALLPAFRGQGLGTGLLRDLQAEAAGRSVPVRLYVESFNRAQTLYQRLGFAEISRQGLSIEMLWKGA